MNPFQINAQDIQYLFDSAGIDITVNDKKQKAIITNSGFVNENDERYISTLLPIHMGDLVRFNGEIYIIITETIGKRHAKYRAVMRHCNFIVSVPGEIRSEYLHDENGDPVMGPDGRPVIIKIEGDPIHVPSIIDNKYFQVNNQFQMRVADNQIVMIIQDNEVNKEKFSVNFSFNLMDRKWKVLHQDRTNKGMLILTCERTT